MATFDEVFGFGEHGNKEERFLEAFALSIQIAIQEQMSRKGVSKSDLARTLGVSAARVSQILAGHGSNLTLKTIAKVASALELELEAVRKEDAQGMWESREVGFEQPYVIRRRARNVGAYWRDDTANENRYPIELAA